MATNYRSWVNPPVARRETTSGRSRVEVAGYMSAQARILALIGAGKRLDQYRKEQYDTMDPCVDPPVDPLRRPGVDPAVVSDMRDSVSARLRDQKRRAQEKKKAEQEEQPIPGIPAGGEPAKP